MLLPGIPVRYMLVGCDCRVVQLAAWPRGRGCGASLICTALGPAADPRVRKLAGRGEHEKRKVPSATRHRVIREWRFCLFYQGSVVDNTDFATAFALH